eukprot:5909857-Prymnesium_polylepis.1
MSGLGVRPAAASATRYPTTSSEYSRWRLTLSSGTPACSHTALQYCQSSSHGHAPRAASACSSSSQIRSVRSATDESTPPESSTATSSCAAGHATWGASHEAACASHGAGCSAGRAGEFVGARVSPLAAFGSRRARRGDRSPPPAAVRSEDRAPPPAHARALAPRVPPGHALSVSLLHRLATACRPDDDARARAPRTCSHGRASRRRAPSAARAAVGRRCARGTGCAHARSSGCGGRLRDVEADAAVAAPRRTAPTPRRASRAAQGPQRAMAAASSARARAA